MSVPLYLKYRPSKLAELVGQDIVAKTLGNSIKAGKIANAYILTGQRGCGKTSTARIIARSLNCKSGPTIDPCGTCTNCIEISKSISPDVIEIDAASHRKLEDAKHMIERCYFAPQTGKYKIYILDEIHMLTREAWNALLKIIEEPPENVVFIFATTEEHKVLPTILSRCQRFTFRPIDDESLFKRLKEISELENIQIEENALKAIVRLSKGGFRDALSMLDQISVLSNTNNKIDEKTVLDLLGGLSPDLMEELLLCLFENNKEKTLECSEKLLLSGNDPIQIIRSFSEFCVNKLERELKEKEKEEKNEKLIFIIRALFELENSLRNSTQQVLKFKASLLSICFPVSPSLQAPFISSPSAPVSSLPSSGSSQQTEYPTQQQSEKKKVKEKEKDPDLKTVKFIDTSDSDNGEVLNKILDQISSAPLRSLLKQHAFLISDTKESLILGIGANLYNKVNDKNKIDLIEKIVNKKVIIEVAEKKDYVQPKKDDQDSLKESSDENERNEWNERNNENKEENKNLDDTEQIQTQVNTQSENKINTNSKAKRNEPEDEVLKIAKEYLGGKVIRD